MQEIDPRTHLAHFDARMWADPDLQTLGTQEQRYDTQDIDKSPQNIEIDCLVENKAYEIKWKDATTDGDHVKKEHKRVQIIKDAGYIPVRLMFFEPNREQAIRIQSSLKKLY